MEYRGKKEFAAGQRPAFQEALRFGCKLGWISLGRRDGVLAGTLFVLPSLFVLFALSAIYFKFGNLPWIAEMFDSLKPARLNPSTA
jgi:chromate transporter